ncbi:MAG: hypothetical protein J1F36_06060 [Clostridiales bacterium]|nr:hypothetical protein [Clostridiales bacterium]
MQTYNSSVDAVEIHGGNGGDSGEYVTQTGGEGGRGIRCTNGVVIYRASVYIYGGNAGVHYKLSISGAVGLEAKSLSVNTDARVWIEGGQGSTSKSKEVSGGTGGAPVKINSFTRSTKYSTTFVGGNGGKNSAGGSGGSGYKFTSAEKYSGVTYYDGANG